MSAVITVFGKPGCQPCRMTARFLDRRDIDFEYVDVTKDAEGLELVQSLGYLSMPVVTAGELHFAGYQPDLLEWLG